MQRTTQQERAEAFHRLHTGDGILVLVNAWDAASARLLEQAGSPAIATTSSCFGSSGIRSKRANPPIGNSVMSRVWIP